MKKLLLLFILISCFTGNAQLQNLDFEDWQTANNYVNHWHNVYPVSEPMITGQPFQAAMETNAQSNNYALKLNIWYFYVKQLAWQSAPIDNRPISLEGYYKYEDNTVFDLDGNTVTDTASVRVYLTKWNTTTTSRDTIGTGIVDFPEEKLTYTHFTNTITYISEQVPDSIHVMLDPSRLPAVNNISGTTGEASFFTIDNLTLNQPNLGIDSHIQDNIQLYPNPTNNHVYITHFNGNATVYNLKGQLLLNKQITTDNNAITLSGFGRGVYIVKLESSNGNILYKKVVTN